MQFQAHQLGVDVTRPVVAETTAQGAAHAAGIVVGYWSGEQMSSTIGGRPSPAWHGVMAAETR